MKKVLQTPSAHADEKVLKRILHGLSCRNYRECSEAIPKAIYPGLQAEVAGTDGTEP